ncbi:MAG: hypothetical protein AB1476_01625 [Candidatus Hadarchaeota archaeon]
MDLAWLVPLVVPFVIGLLVGAVIKHALKLIMVLIALVVVLVVTGVLSIGISDLWGRAVAALPQLFGTGSGLINLLPYTSVSFLVGLAIGFLAL